CGLRPWTRTRLRRRWLGMSSRGRADRVLRRAFLRLFSGAGFASPWGFVSRLGIRGWAAGGPGVVPVVPSRVGSESDAVGLAVGVGAGPARDGAVGRVVVGAASGAWVEDSQPRSPFGGCAGMCVST